MLNPQTIAVIKSTVPVLAIHGEAITRRFYDRMFSAHPELLNIFNHANQRQGRQQAALANTVYAAAANIDNLSAILPVVKQIAHKHRSLGVKAEHYPIVGENLLAAIKEVLGEAATPEILEAWADAYGVIAAVFIQVEQEMYAAAEGQSGGWRDFRRFRVARKVKESANITSFHLVTEDGGPLPEFLPGQYISVRAEIPGEKFTHIRQYSLSNGSGKGYLRISTKREDGPTEREKGIVSNYLHAQVGEGDFVEASAPAGEFVLDMTCDRPVVLLSGGVGITPMMGMLHAVAERQPGRSIAFLHATANGEVHAFRDEVEQFVAKGAKVRAYYLYEYPTAADVEAGHFQRHGRVEPDWLMSVLPSQDAEYYFCGPVPFMKAIFGMLTGLGVPRERIHYEIFGPSLNLAE